MEDCIFIDDHHIVSLEYIFYQTGHKQNYQTLKEIIPLDRHDTRQSCSHTVESVADETFEKLLKLELSGNEG
jgi:hypothetical protein